MKKNSSQCLRTPIPAILLFASLMLFFSLLPPAAAEESCTQLLMARCEVCHYMTRVCQKIEREKSKKSWFSNPKGSWKRTVKNMVKQGAQLNREEEKLLVECLSRPTPEVLDLCKLSK